MAANRQSGVAFLSAMGVMLVLTLSGVEGTDGGFDAGVCMGYTSGNIPGLCDFQFGPSLPNYSRLSFPDTFTETIGSDDILLSNGLKPVLSATSDDSSCLPGVGLSEDCRRQFYTSGSKIVIRSPQPGNAGVFCQKCFRLKLTNVKLPDGTYLNPGDNNALYPESRRCVVFGVGSGGRC